MKIFNNCVLSILILSMPVVVAGCGRTEQYGAVISGQVRTHIGDILKNPREYEGKDVVIEGKIVRECPTGCWLDLKDESGIIYIDVEPSGFAIPQKLKRKAAVEGTVKLERGRPLIIGKGVEIQ